MQRPSKNRKFANPRILRVKAWPISNVRIKYSEILTSQRIWREQGIERILTREYIVLSSEWVSRLWYRDTRNNTSSPVIFPHFSLSLQFHYYTSLPLHPSPPSCTIDVVGCIPRLDRELNERVGSPRIGHAISARGYHSNPQQTVGLENSATSKSQTREVFERFRKSPISREFKDFEIINLNASLWYVKVIWTKVSQRMNIFKIQFALEILKFLYCSVLTFGNLRSIDYKMQRVLTILYFKILKVPVSQEIETQIFNFQIRSLTIWIEDS